MKKNIGILITVLTVAMLSGCGQKEQAETKEIISETEAITEVVTEVIEEDATLDEVEALLGMQDLETADLLGGGKENWSEDKSLYIGRVYEYRATLLRNILRAEKSGMEMDIRRQNRVFIVV